MILYNNNHYQVGKIEKFLQNQFRSEKSKKYFIKKKKQLFWWQFQIIFYNNPLLSNPNDQNSTFWYQNFIKPKLFIWIIFMFGFKMTRLSDFYIKSTSELQEEPENHHANTIRFSRQLLKLERFKYSNSQKLNSLDVSESIQQEQIHQNVILKYQNMLQQKRTHTQATIKINNQKNQYQINKLNLQQICKFQEKKTETQNPYLPIRNSLIIKKQAQKNKFDQVKKRKEQDQVKKRKEQKIQVNQNPQQINSKQRINSESKIYSPLNPIQELKQLIILNFPSLILYPLPQTDILKQSLNLIYADKCEPQLKRLQIIKQIGLNYPQIKVYPMYLAIYENVHKIQEKYNLGIPLQRLLPFQLLFITNQNIDHFFEQIQANIVLIASDQTIFRLGRLISLSFRKNIYQSHIIFAYLIKMIHQLTEEHTEVQFNIRLQIFRALLNKISIFTLKEKSRQFIKDPKISYNLRQKTIKNIVESVKNRGSTIACQQIRKTLQNIK